MRSQEIEPGGKACVNLLSHFFEPFHWSRLITLYVADVYKRQGILEVIKLQIASSVIYAINLTEPELEDFEEKVKGFVTQERKNTQNIKSTL